MSHDLLAQLAYFIGTPTGNFFGGDSAQAVKRQQPFYIQDSTDLQFHAKPILWEEIDG